MSYRRRGGRFRRCKNSFVELARKIFGVAGPRRQGCIGLGGRHARIVVRDKKKVGLVRTPRGPSEDLGMNAGLRAEADKPTLILERAVRPQMNANDQKFGPGRQLTSRVMTGLMSRI
jgi:hypothetical protein